MMTDPIADMLTRIRNGALARHDRVELPHSRLKEHLGQVLKAEGFLDDVRVSESDDPTGPRTLTLILRYGRDRQSAIDGLRRVSSPGRRVYVRHDRIPRVRSGLGVSILSTSRGVMTDRDARKQRVGGELLCEVW
ncbi:30S ribosomal protein S8 [Pendulispora brunnea]|uniref:Small ribosomal subunit protein uS8 n=1 Tax=Pendulispora brunnea TaxID=2905690 RepID=A0ABZ2K0S4_9BACT